LDPPNDREAARATRMPGRVKLVGLVLVVFLVSLGTCLWPALSRGTLDTPPEYGDGQDYDMIAFTLSRGLGFGYFWDDSDWREPYVRDNTNGKWNIILQRSGAYRPTAYRPPALPVTLSLIYRTFGRDFRVWRILEALLVAGAITLGALLSWRIGGLLAAVAMVAFALKDDLLISISTMYLTEGMAVLGVVLLAWSLVQYSNDRRTIYAAFAGLILG